ncbi:MAG: hypothetical protein IT557_00900 [Alphaproteobacteria bacterium]|nr:hypothetical protein [Alphaproteobacteria bacterium]
MADQTKPPRWAVKLEGHEFDLADARDLFAVDPRFRVTEITGPDGNPATVLMAEELERETSSGAVFTRAARLIDFLNGTMLVEKPDREPLVAECGVYEVDTDGRWTKRHRVLRAEAGLFRIRGSPAKIRFGGIAQPVPAPSPAQRWAIAATNDDAVADLLSYLRGQPDWFNLYKAFEAIRADVTKLVARAQQLTFDQVKGRYWGKSVWVETILSWDKDVAQNLYQTCNWHRHHNPTPPPRTLTIEEARQQLAVLVKRWLDWRT